jgi:hypothetical protein
VSFHSENIEFFDEADQSKYKTEFEKIYKHYLNEETITKIMLETAGVIVETKSPYKFYLIQYQLASNFIN